MYVKSKESNIVNEWQDNATNRARLKNKAWGVEEYKGEVVEVDGTLYVKGKEPIVDENNQIKAQIRAIEDTDTYRRKLLLVAIGEATDEDIEWLREKEAEKQALREKLT